MARSLVIVESPAKAKTINKYLGKNYVVKASIGHVMDLPKKTIGIRLPQEAEKPKKKKARKKNGKVVPAKPLKKEILIDDPKIFEPTLQVIPGKGKVINDLRKAAAAADMVYLAGDPDREGEAISAHLAMVLSKPAKFLINAEELNGDGWKNGKNGKNGTNGANGAEGAKEEPKDSAKDEKPAGKVALKAGAKGKAAKKPATKMKFSSSRSIRKRFSG